MNNITNHSSASAGVRRRRDVSWSEEEPTPADGEEGRSWNGVKEGSMRFRRSVPDPQNFTDVIFVITAIIDQTIQPLPAKTVQSIYSRYTPEQLAVYLPDVLQVITILAWVPQVQYH